jgi:predicted DNA-binding transcriptional regulator YafY
MWGQLYRSAAEGALAKLNNVLPDEQLSEIAWARRSLSVTGIHRGNTQHQTIFLDKLRRAIRETRMVGMLYHSQNRPQPLERLLDPYALIHSAGWWYVVGYCHLRQEVRLFRVDRIREMSLQADTFQMPGDFDARTYMDRYEDPKASLLVRMKFIRQAANIPLANRSSWESVDEQADGSVIVTYSTPDLAWAASIALSHGPMVEVLEPPELRQLLQEWAQAIVQQYQSKVFDEKETTQ